VTIFYTIQDALVDKISRDITW